MDLNKLVPPLELCKLIPAGEFGDSVFVWAEVRRYCECLIIRRGFVTRNLRTFPAPTLEEIMAAMPFCRVYKKTNGTFVAVREKTRISHMNGVTAAMKLWLKLKGIENE